MFEAMKIERGYRSRNVEDARGDAAPSVAMGGRGGSALKLGGGSAALIAVLALVASALGVNIPGLGGGGGGGTSAGGLDPQQGMPAQQQPTPLPPGADPNAAEVDLVNQVTDDIQRVFAQQFKAEGAEYRDAKLRLFRDEVDTGCGRSSAQVGPFYCPPDEKAYIDLSFYDDLKARFGAPGDFAQAYVIAHEFGHHCQNVLGIDEDVRRQTARNKKLENELSVRQELQADCFAGVWAKHSDPKLQIDPSDIEEAIKAAAAIGDDRLQKMAGRAVDPRGFTHGSSAQRVKWFTVGAREGTLSACDTFSVKQP
jgi:uncharacterized protein